MRLMRLALFFAFPAFSWGGSVMLLSIRGLRYLAKEPSLDEVWSVTKTVDPCGVFIQRITE